MDFEAQLQEAAKHGHALVEKYIQECREKIDKSSIITHWQTNNISDWRVDVSSEDTLNGWKAIYNPNLKPISYKDRMIGRDNVIWILYTNNVAHCLDLSTFTWNLKNIILGPNDYIDKISIDSNGNLLIRTYKYIISVSSNPNEPNVHLPFTKINDPNEFSPTTDLIFTQFNKNTYKSFGVYKSTGEYYECNNFPGTPSNHSVEITNKYKKNDLLFHKGDVNEKIIRLFPFYDLTPANNKFVDVIVLGEYIYLLGFNGQLYMHTMWYPSVIPNASYRILKNGKIQTHNDTNVDEQTIEEFYTFDGNLIQSSSLSKSYYHILDPNAPLPRPVRCERHGFSDYYYDFFDKNRNSISGANGENIKNLKLDFSLVFTLQDINRIWLRS